MSIFTDPFPLSDETGRCGRGDGADPPAVEPEPLRGRLSSLSVSMETEVDAGAGRAAGLGSSPPAVEPVWRLSIPATEELHLNVRNMSSSASIMHNQSINMILCVVSVAGTRSSTGQHGVWRWWRGP